MRRVLVLGGGFGGLAAAQRLRQGLGDADEVVVVDRRDTFAMGFAKLWDLVGLRPIAAGTGRLANLAHLGVRFVQAEIDAINPERRAVTTSDGDLEADAVLVALGAEDRAGLPAPLPEAVHNLYDWGALPAMREALSELRDGRLLIAVLGQPFKCPPAPFEAALLLDEHLRARGDRGAVELTIATPAPSALPVAGPEASQLIADALADRGVELLTEHLAVDVGDKVVGFDSGSRRDFDLLFAVPGTVPPTVIADSPLAGEGGWITPDPQTLRTDFARVYAAGDCTTVPTAVAALPKAGVFAAGEAAVAAANILADLGLGEPATYDGHGFCYLEFPGREVAQVEGNFFATPKPDVAMTPPSRQAYEAKLAFERDRLDTWLPPS